VKQLIVNADDFGYTRGVNRAIVEGLRRGIVTSTSLMANGAAFDDAVERAKMEPGLDVGCHLNLVEGDPVARPSEIPHLVGTNGRFHRLRSFVVRLAAGAIPAAEIERECSAQIEKLLAAGLRPSHLDTHQHTHLHPRVARVLARVARRHGIAWIRRPFENFSPPGDGGVGLRRLMGVALKLFRPEFDRCMAEYDIRLTDFFTGYRLTGCWTKLAMEATLGALQEGITELMCHPGYCESELEASPTMLRREREQELEILTDPEWRARLSQGGVVLQSFRGAAAAPARNAVAEVLQTAPLAGK
jgi:hopanoid biosynthesis associated protein HpnK